MSKALLGGYHVDDTIEVPSNHAFGIGIVGCGGIVNYAHLPAYRKAGFNVVACFDQQRDTAEKTAADHGISTVSDSLEALLANPAVDIVDIAVTPWAQTEIAAQVIAAGKHLLCQKPLAMEYGIASDVVRAASSAEVVLAVNQQMRWDSGIRVSKQLIEAGALGIVADARIEVSIRTPWHMWPWIAQSDRLEVMYHSIHYLDAIRYLFGNPVAVTAFHNRWPGQPEVGETRTLAVLDYPGDLRVTIDVNHHNWSDDAYARFRWLGTSGVVEGTLGLLYDYPTGRVDTLRFQPNSDPHVWHDAPLTTWWIPDAFVGPMASLMASIGSTTPPLTSGEDNLGTVALVLAAYRSAAEQRRVTVSEITGDA